LNETVKFIKEWIWVQRMIVGSAK